MRCRPKDRWRVITGVCRTERKARIPRERYAKRAHDCWLRFVYQTTFGNSDKKPPRSCEYYYCSEPKKGFKRSGDSEYPFTCTSCGHKFRGRRTVIKREKRHEKPGAYGDGYFCNLTCGVRFARAAAATGTRLRKKGGGVMPTIMIQLEVDGDAQELVDLVDDLLASWTIQGAIEDPMMGRGPMKVTSAVAWLSPEITCSACGKTFNGDKLPPHENCPALITEEEAGNGS